MLLRSSTFILPLNVNCLLIRLIGILKVRRCAPHVIGLNVHLIEITSCKYSCKHCSDHIGPIERRLWSDLSLCKHHAVRDTWCNDGEDKVKVKCNKLDKPSQQLVPGFHCVVGSCDHVTNAQITTLLGTQRSNRWLYSVTTWSVNLIKSVQSDWLKRGNV